MRSIEDLDRWIGAKVKGWSTRLGGGTPNPEVLEIHRDILEDVRDRLEPKGKGRYFFPYNHIAIHLGAGNDSQASLYRSAFGDLAAGGGSTFTEEIRALLAEAGADPGGLVVDIDIAVDAALAWTGRPFRMDYLNRTAVPPKASEPAVRPPARLVVVKGAADAEAFPMKANRVNIGRLREVISEKEGLRRLNDVAFEESETTVSREHAFLIYDTDGGRFRLCDDQSQRGTSIFRAGRRIEVPKGSRRGTQLQSGDEIHLGEARLRFEIESA
jgi:hypothetical protein